MLVDKTKWGQYWFTHRDSFHSTHWVKVKRTPHGRAEYDHLVKCAYFACHEHGWSIEDFSNEVGLSETTARKWAEHFSSVYGAKLAGHSASRQTKTKNAKQALRAFSSLIRS